MRILNISKVVDSISSSGTRIHNPPRSLSQAFAPTPIDILNNYKYTTVLELLQLAIKANYD